MKIPSFSSAVAAIVPGCPFIPSTLIAGVYDGVEGFV
jgi:Ni,Fe-hydrogenase III small subunit